MFRTVYTQEHIIWLAICAAVTALAWFLFLRHIGNKFLGVLILLAIMAVSGVIGYYTLFIVPCCP